MFAQLVSLITEHHISRYKLPNETDPNLVKIMYFMYFLVENYLENVNSELNIIDNIALVLYIPLSYIKESIQAGI